MISETPRMIVRSLFCGLFLLFACGDDSSPKTVDASSDATSEDSSIDAKPPSKDWPLCPGDDNVDHLHQKANAFDEIARRLHVHPKLKFMTTVQLKDGAEASTATYNDVETFRTDANDGLWSGLFLASQAFRYAATKDSEALNMIRLLLEGVRERSEVTGTKGLFARTFLPPGNDFAKCPEDPSVYTVSLDRKDNKWVKINDDGCLSTYSFEDKAWNASEVCIDKKYANYCFIDNVSIDEYAGHFYSLGAIIRYVDDEAIRNDARELVHDIWNHLSANKMKIIGWDGRDVEHGTIFGAEMIAGFLETMIASGDDQELKDIDACMYTDTHPCLPGSFAGFNPLDENLGSLNSAIYTGEDACKSNWNSLSMGITSYQNIFWFLDDDKAIANARKAITDTMFFDSKRAVGYNHNPWYTFTWAASTDASSDEARAHKAMEEAMCALSTFPTTRVQQAVDATQTYETDCIDRLGDEFAASPVPPEDRCPTRNLWWFPTYRIEKCEANEKLVFQPSDYLMAYWYGRLNGFIPAPTASMERK